MRIELAQDKDSSVALTWEGITKNLKFLLTLPESWAGREGPPLLGETKMRQCKLGEFCWVAPVS